MDSGEVVQFLRERNYVFRKELGEGACGKTVLLYDADIDCEFVCKKYAPRDELQRARLFEHFRREIKLLHLLHHANVVRVFNFYLYPRKFTGYILMEYVDGADIEAHIGTNPQHARELLRQAIEGFCYLEENGILHRDIRPGNLLVSADGRLKIIDFGFGKQIVGTDSYSKSVSLNWWCDTPNEFAQNRYDFTTEVYFVGKLFQSVIEWSGLEEFEYSALLCRMCAPDPRDRIPSFAACRSAMIMGGAVELEFSQDDISTYRVFAENLCDSITKMEAGIRYVRDPDEVLRRLEALYPSVMLEEHVPASHMLIRCFLEGTYFYSRRVEIATHVLRAFLVFFRACSPERRSIVLGNIHSKLDTVTRYETTVTDDDVPF